MFSILLKCGIADWARGKGSKNGQTQNFWVLILFRGTSTHGATWDLEWKRRGPLVAALRVKFPGDKIKTQNLSLRRL